MNKKEIPFTKEDIEKLSQEHPTPFYIYDQVGIENRAKELNNTFNWVEGGYRNFFAVKALPNPHIMKVLKNQGMGADCSSMAELVLAEKVGLKGEEIMFTSNDTPIEEFEKARELGAIINFDDFEHIDFYYKNIGELPDLVCFRYNPGPLKEGNDIIGNPVEAKYGLTKDQLFEGYKKARELGATRFGLHTMVVSNMLDIDYLVDTARMLYELAVELKNELGIELEFVNLGGGLGIPYLPNEKMVDIQEYGNRVREEFEKIAEANGLEKMRTVSEFGRAVTGPFGYLVTKVRHIAHKYKDYVGLDSCMSNLMRPALYGSYHHITVLGKENLEEKKKVDVVGSLCENNDKFAIDRELPEVEAGDILVIHDAGAHGHAMGFQYNGKLRSAEFLMDENKKFKMIRRAETLDDYFGTLDLNSL